MWLQWVTAVHSRLPSGYSESQQITTGYRAGNQVATVGHSRLELVDEWLQWVT